MAQTDFIITEAAPKPQPPASSPEPARRPPGLRLAVLAGALLWLACPPVTLWPLAWVAVAPLILSVTRATRLRQALWRGYLFGWVYLGAVWYWTGLTIVAWTHSAIGWAAWFGLTLILALFYAAWGGAAWLLTRPITHHPPPDTQYPTPSSHRPTPNTQHLPPTALTLVGLAAAWVVMEWARTLGPITMPWAQLSYTQYHFLPVLQIADVTGAYGVSFLILLVNGAVAAWWMRGGHPDRARWLRASLLLIGLVCLYGQARLAAPEGGTPLTVAAIQNNADPFQEQRTAATLQTFADLTRRAAAAAKPPPALYVWPEFAAPGDGLHSYFTREALTTLAREYHAPLLVGSHIIDPGNGAESNASLLFPSDGGAPLRYDKVQLVPFGEFIPYRAYIPTFLKQQFAMFDSDVVPGQSGSVWRFTAGAGGQGPGAREQGTGDRGRGPGAGEHGIGIGVSGPRPLAPGPAAQRLVAVALGPFICYESMYPRYAREMTRAGANLLVTQSNDAWFQSRAAMEQHLAAVVLRAIENRRCVVRSTTTGVTCLLDSKGNVFARAPLRTPSVVVGKAPLLEDRTLYTRWGDWFVALCGGLMFFTAAGVLRRLRR